MRILPVFLILAMSSLVLHLDAEGQRAAMAPALILRGFEPRTALDGIAQAKSLERSGPNVKAMGAGIIQFRVHWSIVEPVEGSYDWSAYDRLDAACKNAKLRWAPIIVAGGVDGVPRWFRTKPGFKAYSCLEHNQEGPIVSRWYPQLRPSALKFVQAFCNRYRNSQALESVTLGVAGADGRAALPGFESNSAGHVHPGLWINDDYAAESFQIWLASRYGGSGPLRDAWGGLTQGIPYVRPFLKRDAPSERAWLDQLDWMAESMTQWARLWLKEARTALPDTPIYVRTAAGSPGEAGLDLAAQAKAAAEFNAGIQAVCESGDHRGLPVRAALAAASTLTARIPLRLEIDGSLSVPSLSASLFAAAASDSLVLNYGMASMSPLVGSTVKAFKTPKAATSDRPTLAVYHPQTYAKLIGAPFVSAIQAMRDRFDFDLIGDSQILDGALSRYKALVFVHGNVIESKALRDILAWARKGGTIVYPEGMGRLLTVERLDTYHRLIFSSSEADKPNRAVSLPFRGNSVEYRDRVVETLASILELPPNERAALQQDSDEDGLLYAINGDSKIWLNLNSQPKGKAGVTIPAFGVVQIPFPKRSVTPPARAGSARSTGGRSTARPGSRG